MGNGDQSWGSLVAHGAPVGVVRQLNRQLRHRFVAQYGAAQIAMALARLLPFGAGAAVGGIAGAASSGTVIKTTRKAFDV